MWRRKRKKKAPQDWDEPDIREIVPMVHYEEVIVPERLSPDEEPDSEDELKARSDIAKRFSLDIENTRKVENILNNIQES